MTISEMHDCASLPGFANLLEDKDLLAGLAKLSIEQPTEVQTLSIPLAMQNKDLVVQAQTGSGKTLAFVLPILAKIKAVDVGQHTAAIIITPTRELAVQVKAVVESLAPGVTPSCIIGGASARDQELQLEKDARIIVGTPGRLLDFLRQRLIVLKKCSTFVLDEADEMLDMGFIDEVQEILSKLPKNRQGLFFSATISNRVASLANKFLRDQQTIVVEKNSDNAAKIEHLFYSVDGGVTSKIQALSDLFKACPNQSAIVFCNTKSDTELVEVTLRRRNFNASKINSDLSQKQRDAVIAKLRSGELRYLIATDVAARGIDIPDLEMVINYSLSNESEVYVHRTGRTGRAGASGKAISLIGPRDLGIFYSLKRFLGVEIREISIKTDEHGACHVNYTNGVVAA